LIILARVPLLGGRGNRRDRSRLVDLPSKDHKNIGAGDQYARLDGIRGA
jgi:hypothetical protein